MEGSSTPFPEIPVSKNSIGNRRLIAGVGINDAWHKVTHLDEKGKQTQCPYYSRWKNIINRCHKTKYQDSCPTYRDCKITPDWLLFSVFRKWMESQSWEGKQIDKDILVHGNKLYSPDTCIFVTHQLNSLILSGGSKGDKGVSWCKRRLVYRSYCNNGNRTVNLGEYGTRREGVNCYLKYKASVVRGASEWDESRENPRLQAALLAYADKLESQIE